MSDALPCTPACTIRCEGGVNTARFSGDGQYLIGGGAAGAVRLWDSGGALLTSFQGASQSVVDAAVGNTNALAAACGDEKAVFVWDVRSGDAPTRWLRGHQARVQCLAFTNDDQVLFTGGDDATVRAWDMRAARAVAPLQTLTAAKDAVTCLAVNGHTVVAGSTDGCVRHYDIRSGVLSVDTLGAAVACVSTNQANTLFLATTLDSTHRLFDARLGTRVQEYRGHRNTAHKVRSCFTHDEAHVLAGSEDGRAYYWHTDSGRMAKAVAHGAQVVVVAAASPTGGRAACGGDNGELVIYECR